MRRISSKWTFFYKRVFPIIWFGFLVLFLAGTVFAGRHSNQSSIVPFLIVPIIMVGVGYFIMKKLVFDLVDEVWDDGDALVVMNGDQKERVPFADIKNVNYSPFINPPRVTLSLRRPTAFGEELNFAAPIRFVPFSKSPAIVELIDRVDAARQRKR